MIEKKGNMFDSGADILLVTTNATLKGDGSLVMGRGAARECTTRFPGCQFDFGKCVNYYQLSKPVDPDYGILLLPNYVSLNGKDHIVLGIFQVKRFWGEKASLRLMAKSAEMLYRLAVKEWKDYKIALNFPGIGNGGRYKAEVWPLVHDLPDNVELWTL